MDTGHPPLDLLERLRRHRTLGSVPEAELEWLVARGVPRHFEPGEFVLRAGADLSRVSLGLEVMLSGRMSTHVDRGAGERKVMEWKAGDLTGIVPFSRMTVASGNTIADTAVDTLSIAPGDFPDLIRDCPQVTAACVHMMVDRARVFRTSDLQHERMMSLGKLSAGLAHELNNPASAVARSARLVQETMHEVDRAARGLAGLGLTPDQLAAVDRLRQASMAGPGTGTMSPLDRADREDEIADWMADHGGGHAGVDALAEAAVTLEDLDALARHLEGQALAVALDWVAASCAVRMLADQNARAGSRITDLVSAMKRLTHMDRAPVPEDIDVEQGLRDTLLVLDHKALAKSVKVTMDVAPGLPRVNAVGGELEQVWMNVLDNAFDAVEEGGRVTVDARPEGRSLVVRIVDDGPGIPPEVQDRVFDPFFTTKAPGAGTGLGLDMARAYLWRQRGDIDFESRPGRTEFRVRLPLAGSPSIPA